MITLLLLLALNGPTSIACRSRFGSLMRRLAEACRSVELRTVDAARYVTDNAGLVAFDEPGLMGTDALLSSRTDTSTPPMASATVASGSGPKSWAEATVVSSESTSRSVFIGSRAGASIATACFLGRPTPLAKPAINGLVLGQDSVVNGVLNGTL